MANLIFHKRMSIAQYKTFKIQHTVNGILDDEFKNTLFVLNETGTFTGTDDCIFYMGEHLISYASYKKTLSLTSQSTDNEFPTAKCVYDAINTAMSEVDLGGYVQYGDEIISVPDFDSVKLVYTDLSMQDIHGFHKLTRETANCYVINSPGYYMLPLVYGNAIVNGRTNTSSYTNLGGQYQAAFVNYKGNQITSPFIETDTGETATTARIEISDTNNIISNIEIKTDTVENIKFLCFKVLAVPSTGANAVLSILDDEDTIMWSWHIWLWSENLDPVTIINHEGNEYRLLPVNLGSKYDEDGIHLKNWFYQWGRKDPMLCPESYNSNTDHTSYGSTSFSISNAAGSVSDAIKNPCTFYKYSSSYNYNWVQLNYFYNFWDATCNSTGWNEKEVVKTIYDPCPAGYSIPNARVFTGFTTTGDYIELGDNVDTEEEFMASINVTGNWQSGWNFKTASGGSVFFPASGYRSNSNGAIYSMSSYGYYWSAGAPSRDGAGYLYFNSGNVDPLNGNYRACGFSVRLFSRS